MDKVEMIKEAINDSGLYSNNQCKIVNVLLDIAVNNVAQANVRFLEEKTGVKKPTIYFALKIFKIIFFIFFIKYKYNGFFK